MKMKILKPSHIAFLIISTIVCVATLQAEISQKSNSVVPLHSSTNTPYFNKKQTEDETKILVNLYQLNKNQLLWLNNVECPSTIINQLLVVLSLAKEQGLNPADYKVKKLNDHWLKMQQSQPDFFELAHFDQALSLTFIRYLNDLHYGRINPKSMGFHLPQKKSSKLAEAIFNALKNNALNALIISREPNNDAYKKLKIALKRYHKINILWSSPLAFNFEKSLRPGDWSTQMTTLKNYLDLVLHNTPPQDQENTYSSNTYTREIVNKIRKLQKMHHLVIDGIIGKQTLAVLNTPIIQRIKQIELSMERIRWLPEQQEGANIFVNIPSFQLWAYNSLIKNDKLSMKIIVGKTKRRIKNKKRYKTAKQIAAETKSLQTPVFTANLSFLVFNPYWNIPKNILQKDILPRLEKNSDYLEQNNMEIVPRFSHHAEVLPNNEENISQLYTNQLRLRQRPGNTNALGEIKFIFPNDHAVYIHDTPFKSLFDHDKRDFSHGCIRIENPKALAKFILKNRKNWNKYKTKSILKTKAPTIVGVLSSKIPVLIFYTTVLPSKTGVSFYPDIYDLDKMLIAALAAHSQGISTN